MTENKGFNDFRGYKRFDSYFDDYMQLWTVSDNESDNILYPCISENMTNEFTELLNELHDENEQLKEQLEICKDARQAYKQDWKACVSYCDTYKNEIHTLKDNIQGLIEENKMLKNNVEKLSEDVRFLAKLDDYNYKKTYTKEHLE